MSENTSNESLLDVYIFETTQLIEELEQLVISGEKGNGFSDCINEIFRIMHTVKGASAMMMFDNIAELSHAVEDLFYYLREEKPGEIDCNTLGDIVLEAIDFIRNEIVKIQEGNTPDGDGTSKISNIEGFLKEIKEVHESDEVVEKQQIQIEESSKVKKTCFSEGYEATVHFDEGCGMENIRCFEIIHKVSQIGEVVSTKPKDVLDSEDDEKVNGQIRNDGFNITFSSDLDMESVKAIISETFFINKLKIKKLNEERFVEDITTKEQVDKDEEKNANKTKKKEKGASHQGFISLSLDKANKLMDLIGELVMSESMVTQNPDLIGLELGNFQKSARQLRKIIAEVQDTVMSIRMVPLSATFQKLNRIVRDMSKKMDKEVKLTIIGEETEVDKNIIEHISDPLMHIVRNSIDHGIETTEERVSKGKDKVGSVTLQAKNSGSDVLIIVKDDGKGMSEEKILKKARENGLLIKDENEMTREEIFNLIFLPGFSTKEAVTEYSGRGVGMDVVAKNIEKIGGSVRVDSTEGVGTSILIKIPLTLAIIDGMNVKVGKARYTLPTSSIKEFFRPKDSDIINDPDNNEMIMVRGKCYPIVRLNEHFSVETNISKVSEGVLIMVEQDNKGFCIWVDELLGQQQVVVKALPSYIKNIRNIKDLSGCTLLGDGNISLIIDITGLINLIY
ncbi:chemotaxis protein CheA [Clostridium cibarium]|uniref:Chemotaxis protein CheA n=1 Tax=Clostridium cibarium TaxID=2762247 RepID=A0ABR8PUA8_9CLOT|nr:chemotaxis protein CheA [Clostridium cibarium]MBD7911709.1 chemotaxis protein CheA [Clostridium cibarium]